MMRISSNNLITNDVQTLSAFIYTWHNVMYNIMKIELIVPSSYAAADMFGK